ncbi:MAG: NAD(P)-dependent oxidoreductase [Deltaproteobacteria bacterium]|nr:NAD(P)-dependent oxidoreductase [Deltaproteobacteria bacterium]
MKNKRIIITGATGFVGANLTHRLCGDGHEVHLLVRENFRPWRIDSILKKINLHITDFAHSERLAGLVRDIQPHRIFHMAAYGAYSDQKDFQQMIQTNFIGTVNLVEACIKTGCEAFIHTGSSSEYGFKDHPPSEKEWLEPNSHYAVTKASATLFCTYAAMYHHLPLLTLRLYSVYGPWEESTRLIPTLISRGLRGELPPLVSPEIARDFVFTEDVITAYLLAADLAHRLRGAVYNVGTGVQTSIREVVETACEVMDIKTEPVWGSMTDRIWDTSIWTADTRAIQEELGWHPRYGFDQGFREAVAWFRKNMQSMVA